MNAGLLGPAGWAIGAGYFAGMLWLGGRFRRRQRSAERYFLGNRAIPGCAVGLSMFATFISSWAFLALPAKAFQSDLQYLMADAAFDFVSLVGGGVLGMCLLGLTVPRCGAAALYIGIACGMAFAAWSYFCAPGKTALAFPPRFPLHPLWVGLISKVIVFTVGFAASLFIRGPQGTAEGAA